MFHSVRAPRRWYPLTASVLLGWVATLGAQKAPVERAVKHAASCNTCRMELTKVATLGSPGDPELLNGHFVDRDSKGRYFTANFDRSKVVVFDASGKYATAFGTLGDGPGEIRRPGIDMVLVGPGDSLYVISGGRSRVDVLSSGFKAGRRFTLSASSPSSIHVLRGGAVFIGATLNFGEKVGLNYHLLGARGRIVQSYGDSSFKVVPGGPRSAPLHGFVMSPDEKGLISVTNDYSITERRIDGTPGRAFQLTDIPGYTPPIQSTVTARGQSTTRLRPTSLSTLAGVDTSGLVWATFSMGVMGPATNLKYRLDVFDLKTGSIVTSRDTEHFLTFLPRSNLAYSTSGTPDGVASITIWRVVLRR